MSALKDKLAEAWVEDLKERMDAEHAVYPMRRPKSAPGGRIVEPPFAVLTVMEMEQTTPGSNVWTAQVRAVVVCDKDQGDSPEQKERVGELYEALEGTERPAGDDVRGVRLYGFSVDRIEQARAEKVFSDVIFVTAGVGDLASSPDAVPE